MLQIAPDVDIEREVDEKTDDAIYCANCGKLITRGRWKLSLGGHEHVFTNPAGVTFRILCFTEAPGAASAGDLTDKFTWFVGYLWNFARCRGCGELLGWHYCSDDDPPKFFGLIKPRLSSRPQ